MSAAVLPPLKGIGFESRRTFARIEFEKMLASDIFAGQRFELIDGDLIDKIGQNPPHASSIRRLMKLLARIVAPERILVQSPVDVAMNDRERNLPEPDLAVLLEDKPEFDVRHPCGDELLLVVEVADTSLVTDTTVKRDLYARPGVPEYWVIDLNGRRVIVHAAVSQGIYTQISSLSENELLTLDGHSIAIASLLP
jgi:Uma2 family endonuclease